MIYAATGNAGPAFGDQPSRAGLIIRRSRAVNNMSAPVLPVAHMLVLVRRLWAGLVFDELALVTQPLSLGRLGVALVVVV